jgi:hypothetical protein
MEAPLSLRKPSNWQDFETLCKKLWGEIWDCSEIKKNGRAGQVQHGVDIYGIPRGEKEYYGIQCKGKDEYTNKQFTEAEITSEIEKAELFQPALKKLYFATTAIKDANIEEFVRNKNSEHLSKNLFEVHIFSWEDIVELIDENKRTHDYYLKSQNYISKQSVSITFQNGLTELTITPQFKQTVIYRRQKAIPLLPISNSLVAAFAYYNKIALTMPHVPQIKIVSTKINQSLCPLYFQIHNNGTEALEEFKLLFEIKGDLQEMTNTNKDGNRTTITFKTPDIKLNSTNKTGQVLPRVH